MANRRLIQRDNGGIRIKKLPAFMGGPEKGMISSTRKHVVMFADRIRKEAKSFSRKLFFGK